MAKPPNGVNRLARLDCSSQSKSMAKQDKLREERLAKALRDNLRRRKAQARKLGGAQLTADDSEYPSRR